MSRFQKNVDYLGSQNQKINGEYICEIIGIHFVL